MNTTFSQKDLVSFGNYVMSLIQRRMKLPEPDGSYSVTHADCENWKVGEDVKTRALVPVGMLSNQSLSDLITGLEIQSDLTDDQKAILKTALGERNVRDAEQPSRGNGYPWFDGKEKPKYNHLTFVVEFPDGFQQIADHDGRQFLYPVNRKNSDILRWMYVPHADGTI